MFTSRNNQKWLDDLPKILHAYDHSIHRVIKTKPANVNEENAITIWERLYGNGKSYKSTLKNIEKGDLVRISKVKRQFLKGYLQIGIAKNSLLMTQIKIFTNNGKRKGLSRRCY